MKKALTGLRRTLSRPGEVPYVLRFSMERNSTLATRVEPAPATSESSRKMTVSSDPGRPSREGRASRAQPAADRPRKPVLQRFSSMLERRRAAARARGRRARRDQASIRREKATARQEQAARAGQGAGASQGPAGRSVSTRITDFGARASGFLLAAAAPVAAGMAALAELDRRALAWLAVEVTPLRAAVAVTAIAAVLLGVSQFTDYRGVAVGVEDYAAYADVEPVAPAPQVDRRDAGDPHAYLLVPLAVLALALVVAAARGRWQLGRVVSLLGLVALAVAILVDVPAGLDEGDQAIAYASVEAQLLEGFYAQVVSAAVLVAGGLLVARYARPARRPAPTGRRDAAVRRLGARPA